MWGEICLEHKDIRFQAAPCSGTNMPSKTHRSNSSYIWSKNPNSFALWGKKKLQKSPSLIQTIATIHLAHPWVSLKFCLNNRKHRHTHEKLVDRLPTRSFTSPLLGAFKSWTLRKSNIVISQRDKLAYQVEYILLPHQIPVCSALLGYIPMIALKNIAGFVWN